MILVMLPLISWVYVQRMLERIQLLLEMHLERRNCLQQWKWKVSEYNCDQICSLFLVVDMSRFISQLFLLWSWLTGYWCIWASCCMYSCHCIFQSDTTVCCICMCNCMFYYCLSIPGQVYKVMCCIARKGKVKLSVDTMKAYCRSRGMAPLILNLAAGWRWVVSIMPWPLLLWERSLVYIEFEAAWALEMVWIFGRYILKYLELMKLVNIKTNMYVDLEGRG
jgi:hypothetical protein